MSLGMGGGEVYFMTFRIRVIVLKVVSIPLVLIFRICPGIHFADQMLWFTMVMLLATTRILPAKDPDGNDIMPKAEYSGGMVR